jgi:hypothetical protein
VKKPLTARERAEIFGRFNIIEKLLVEVEVMIGDRWPTSTSNRWHRIRQSLALLLDNMRNGYEGWS